MRLVWDLFFVRQKTAYEMRISDWSSDVCSSDLVVYAESGASGGVASKLMFLAPGRYRLSWRTVNEASDETGPTNMLGGVGVPRTERGGLFWTISCPGLQGTELATAAAERTDAKGRPVAVDFDVPADCTAQNLVLQARIDSSDSGVQWTLSDLSVRPIAAARDRQSTRLHSSH